MCSGRSLRGLVADAYAIICHGTVIPCISVSLTTSTCKPGRRANAFTPSKLTGQSCTHRYFKHGHPWANAIIPGQTKHPGQTLNIKIPIQENTVLFLTLQFQQNNSRGNLSSLNKWKKRDPRLQTLTLNRAGAHREFLVMLKVRTNRQKKRFCSTKTTQ